jgi:glucose-1-phosphate thymidylyltransferase
LDVEEMVKSFSDCPLMAVYDTQSIESAKQFGVVSVDGKTVTEFVEKPAEPNSTLVSTGIYIFPPKVFPEIISYAQSNSDNLGGIFEHLIKNHEVHAFTFDGSWIDIGSFQAYLTAHKHLYHPSRSHQPSMKGSTIGDKVSFGSQCEVVDSVLENVVVGNNCKIHDCIIRNSIIDDNCELIGVDLDHKMVRAGSTIGAS